MKNYYWYFKISKYILVKENKTTQDVDSDRDHKNMSIFTKEVSRKAPSVRQGNTEDKSSCNWIALGLTPLVSEPAPT